MFFIRSVWFQLVALVSRRALITYLSMSAAHRPVLGPDAATSDASQLPQLDDRYDRRSSTFADYGVARCTTTNLVCNDDDDGSTGWCKELERGRMLYAADPAVPGPGKCSSSNERLDTRIGEETDDVKG